MPSEYTFLVRKPSGRVLAFKSADPEPFNAMEAAVDDDVYPVPGQPGMWTTLDRHSTVERFRWIPVGALPEDHHGVGVPVVRDVAA
jgi:hypothetical protein